MAGTTYTHKDLLADIREICKKNEDDRSTAQQVDACLKQALRNPALLEGWEGYDAAKPFNLLYKDPDFGFYITASTLEPDYFRMPHDHGTIGWNIYGTFRNQFVQRLFRRLDDGSQEGHAVLELVGEYPIEAGETYTLLVEDIHQDTNVSSGPSTSVIVRQKDSRQIPRNVYHPEKNLVKSVTSGNLLLRSRADYDAFFAGVLKPVS